VHRVLSGIQPSGDPHIGNYLGAWLRWVGEQVPGHFFCIVDQHAITVPYDPADLRQRTVDLATWLLAAGLDPEVCTLFVQSQVREHTELAWNLNCVATMGELARMTQFKEKSEGRESVSVGLFDYPVLQAADILLYQAEYVPVGDDQRQHVEITRDIAQRFHHLFGTVFTLPAPLIRESGARIMGLDDPSIKMSKSLAGLREGHAIGLLDSPKKIQRSVMRAVTDSGSQLDPEHISPGVENLLVLFETLTGLSREATLAKFVGQGYGALKRDVAEVAIEKVTNIQDRYRSIREDDIALDRILADGAERAGDIAGATLGAAMRATGLR